MMSEVLGITDGGSVIVDSDELKRQVKLKKIVLTCAKCENTETILMQDPENFEIVTTWYEVICNKCKGKSKIDLP
jgi:hypothetical protein